MGGPHWVLQQHQPRGTLTEPCLQPSQSTHLGRVVSDSPSRHGSTEEFIRHTKHHSLGQAYTKVLDVISGVTFWTNSALLSSPIHLSLCSPGPLGCL